MFQEMINRSTVSVPDDDIRRLHSASSGEMENFGLRQENDAAAAPLGTNAKVANVFDCQEIFRIVAADPLVDSRRISKHAPDTNNGSRLL